LGTLYLLYAFDTALDITTSLAIDTDNSSDMFPLVADVDVT